MLRAARFAAKLGFDVHLDSAVPISRLAHLVDGVPSARLFDEFLKLFQTGHALASYHELRRFGLFEHLFPATAAWLEPGEEPRRRFIEEALADTDARVAEDRPVTPMFLLGVFLWGPVADRAAVLTAEGMPDFQALAWQQTISPGGRNDATPSRQLFNSMPRLQVQTGSPMRVLARWPHREHRFKRLRSVMLRAVWKREPELAGVAQIQTLPTADSDAARLQWGEAGGAVAAGARAATQGARQSA